MNWLRWLIIVLALLEAGWMAFDGGRAFVTGDYVTPKSGKYAGQLGPWAKVVSAIGIEPRSGLMKSSFIIYGAAWLFIIFCFAIKLQWSWLAMVIAAVGSLWYLWIGAVLSLVLLLLLLLPGVRNIYSGEFFRK